jgi:hypothetical protein
VDGKVAEFADDVELGMERGPISCLKLGSKRKALRSFL